MTDGRSGPPAAARLHEWLLIGVIVALDQITKQLVVRSLAVRESVTIIPGLLDFTHVRNTGAAFGLLNSVDFPGKTMVISGVALAALLVMAAYAAALPARQKLARLGLALVLGGAAGNLIDRIRQGYVVDYVDFYWRGWHFWAFNVADAAITIGVGLVILDLLRPREEPAAVEARES
ncbi:MAG TPA: signal peptidase II [Vicinamibacterales bacterium]|nr:signal peptidase II [Vicinamibacterales bacterium]